MDQNGEDPESEQPVPPKPNPLRFWIVIAILAGLVLSQLSVLL